MQLFTMLYWLSIGICQRLSTEELTSKENIFKEAGLNGNTTQHNIWSFHADEARGPST